VRNSIQDAGALVAGALRACDEIEGARAGADELGETHRHLTDAGRSLGRAEVPSYPIRQHVDRLSLTAQAGRAGESSTRRETSSASWQRTTNGSGIASGRRTFMAANNPTGADWGAVWRSEGQVSRSVAEVDYSTTQKRCTRATLFRAPVTFSR
jgi:hypothetical protein